MQHIGERVQKSIKIVDKVVKYLYENNQPYFGQTVKTTASEVIAYENGALNKRRFNTVKNSTLCEALLLLNCEKDCPKKYRKVVSKLIEAYRVMNGMPGDDFGYGDDAVPTESFGEFTAEIESEPAVDVEMEADLDSECDVEDSQCCEGEDSCGVEQYIVDNTEVGAEYHINDITEDTTPTFGFESQDETINALKFLVQKGYFEVVERDPYNGFISVVKRIR